MPRDRSAPNQSLLGLAPGAARHGGEGRIAARIDRLALGNPGDVEPIGAGVSELRIAHGPGYRVYFVKHGKTLVILLCGGDKGSQVRDIKRAKAMAKELKE